MHETDFRILAMLKRGYRSYDIAKFVGMSPKQIYLETQRLRRQFEAKTNWELVMKFGGYV